MSKPVVNNEIVCMRQSVRKARVGIIWKLTKEAKLLKARKHGDEKVLEKCKRKAKKLVSEIKAIKKLKDDDVSKFAITNVRSLQEVVNDPTVSRKTRVLTKLAFHKVLKSSVVKFKEKFPDYEQYIGPGRKAMAKIQQAEKRKSRNEMGDEEKKNHSNENYDKDIELKVEQESEEEEDEASSVTDDDESEISEAELEKLDSGTKEIKSEAEKIHNEFEEHRPKKQEIELSKETEKLEISKQKEKSLSTRKEVSTGNETNDGSEKNKSKKRKIEQKKKSVQVLDSQPLVGTSPKSKKPESIKIVSNLATVKRLKLDEGQEDSTEISEEQPPLDIQQSEKKILDKEEDSFFFTGNGQSNYLSIKVPRPTNSQEDSEVGDSNNSRKHFNDRNFFNTMDSRNNHPRDRQNYTANNGRRFPNDRPSFSKRENSTFEPRNDRKNKFNNFEKGLEANKNKISEENLHPSWAARKKEQEILKQGFQGKKIIFDD